MWWWIGAGIIAAALIYSAIVLFVWVVSRMPE
jgi:hypothetical protein